MTDKEMLRTFISRAEQVSARVYEVADLNRAFEKTVEICRSKEDLVPQMDFSGTGKSRNRIIAAPNLEEKEFKSLGRACDSEDGISLISKGMRLYPEGIDVGVTMTDFGIAETGTLVLSSGSEETRLASMLSEIHVAILGISGIRPTAINMADELERLMTGDRDYTAFITGSSRTADIERVLATGVHGPLELVIILVEDM